MKISIEILSIIFLSLIITACGGGNNNQSLEAKKSALEKKRKQMMTLSQEIASLEEEIAAMEPATRTRGKVVNVAVEEITPTRLQHFVKVQGQVESKQNVMVSPRTSGTIIGLAVKEGQNVKAGQVIAKLDDAVIQRNIDEVQTQLDLSTTVFQKQKALWEKKIGTEMQYLTAKNNMESLRDRLATLKAQAEMTRIKAPISGTVDEVMSKVGEMANLGMPLFHIVNNSDLRLKADLSETYVPYVRRGDEVMIEFPTLGKTIMGKVTVVGQAIHPQNRTFRVEVELPNDPLLRPNMYGTISINDRTLEDAIAIPLVLVQQSDQGPYVYVATKKDGKWTAERRQVKTGLTQGALIEIVDGLNGGDQLIVSGYKDVSDGQLITLEGPAVATQN